MRELRLGLAFIKPLWFIPGAPGKPIILATCRDNAPIRGFVLGKAFQVGPCCRDCKIAENALKWCAEEEQLKTKRHACSQWQGTITRLGPGEEK